MNWLIFHSIHKVQGILSQPGYSARIRLVNGQYLTLTLTSVRVIHPFGVISETLIVILIGIVRNHIEVNFYYRHYSTSRCEALSYDISTLPCTMIHLSSLSFPTSYALS